jgi:acyl dehydratase
MVQPQVHVGVTYEVHEGRIDADAVKAYARATMEPNDAYERGAAVPPLYTVALVHEAHIAAEVQTLDPGAVRGVTGGVHASHDTYVLGTVEPGMAVQWQVFTRSVLQTAAGVLITQAVRVSDRSGTPLVEHLWSSLLIGGVIDHSHGPELPDHRFPEESRSRPVGERAFPLELDLPFRYAGVSKDHAGHSLDLEIALSEGFAGRILQGLCTFSMCSGALVEIAAEGVPARVRRLAGRFAAPVLVRGDDLVVHVYDDGYTDDGAPSFAFEATQGDRTVVRHGRAELHPG